MVVTKKEVKMIKTIITLAVVILVLGMFRVIPIILPYMVIMSGMCAGIVYVFRVPISTSILLGAIMFLIGFIMIIMDSYMITYIIYGASGISLVFIMLMLYKYNDKIQDLRDGNKSWNKY